MRCQTAYFPTTAETVMSNGSPRALDIAEVRRMFTRVRAAVAALALAGAVGLTAQSGSTAEDKQQSTKQKAEKKKANRKGQQKGTQSATQSEQTGATDTERSRNAGGKTDPQMPESVRPDPTRPGTPPTFPPNDTSPRTPVKPPDPTAPTAVKP
jgi:hypothetical protein